NHPVEILKGSELLRLACGAERIVIAVEKNKLEAVEILNSKNYNLKIKNLEIVSLPVRYPQDSERTLAGMMTGRQLKKAESVLSAGVLVEHVATAFAVYEAVYLNKPLYERVVTVGGPCVVEPKNVWARVGTSAADLIRSAKGLMREPERIIFGGPMTGKTIEHLEIPVTKAVRGVLALPPQLTVSGDPEPCIRCGWCADVCPESLNAEAIVRAVQNEDENLAREFGIEACVDCGCCTYVCPSKIQMGLFIQKGKRRIAVPGTTVPGSQNPAPAVPGTVAMF
ncbi:MAG TPA: 4Fe-4S dicluster domain-containing protein, partial [Candidatus Norongarragalinales archaeon]|nr:4Fe-4S dicluster domain-containing protein [Candidatus Norongarragalinales archaeon]